MIVSDYDLYKVSSSPLLSPEVSSLQLVAAAGVALSRDVDALLVLLAAHFQLEKFWKVVEERVNQHRHNEVTAGVIGSNGT